MQLIILKKIHQSIINYLNTPKVRCALQTLTVVSIACLITNVFAADLLSGTETALLDTLKGTGKKYIYIAEGVTALASYIATKNALVFIGVIVVAIFLNIVLALAA